MRIRNRGAGKRGRNSWTLNGIRSKTDSCDSEFQLPALTTVRVKTSGAERALTDLLCQV